MRSNNYASSEPDNYYVPFLDLMAGVVFILMIILSTEMINIKYESSQVSSNKSMHEKARKLDLFKKKFVSSISLYLTKNKIKNTISSDYNNIYIKNYIIFDDKKLSLSKEGERITTGISEAFNTYLFLKVNKDENFKKNVDFIKSISVNIYPYIESNFESSMISKSFVFYGYLVNTNPQILSFSNGYSPHLIHINDARSVAKPFKDLKTDMILLKFDFCYPQNEEMIW